MSTQADTLLKNSFTSVQCTSGIGCTGFALCYLPIAGLVSMSLLPLLYFLHFCMVSGSPNPQNEFNLQNESTAFLVLLTPNQLYQEGNNVGNAFPANRSTCFQALALPRIQIFQSSYVPFPSSLQSFYKKYQKQEFYFFKI